MLLLTYIHWIISCVPNWKNINPSVLRRGLTSELCPLLRRFSGWQLLCRFFQECLHAFRVANLHTVFQYYLIKCIRRQPPTHNRHRFDDPMRPSDAQRVRPNPRQWVDVNRSQGFPARGDESCRMWWRTNVMRANKRVTRAGGSEIWIIDEISHSLKLLNLTSSLYMIDI